MSKSRKNLLVNGALITGTLGAALYCFREVDYELFLREWGSINWAVLLILFPINLFHYILRAVRWNFFLQSSYSLPARFDALMVGNLANFILPFRLGEFVRAYALSRDKAGEAFASIFCERFFDLVIVLLTFGGMLAIGSNYDPNLSLVVWSMMGLAIAIFIAILSAVLLPTVYGYLLAWAFLFALRLTALGHFQRFEKTQSLGQEGEGQVSANVTVDKTQFSDKYAQLEHNFRNLPDGSVLYKLIRVIFLFANDFLHGVQVIKTPSKLAMLILLSVLVWFANYLFLACSLPLVGYDFSLTAGALLCSTIALAVALPSAPGFIGSYQLGCSLGFVAAGFDVNKALVYSIVTHLFHYLFTLSLGLYSMTKMDFALSLSSLGKLRSSSVKD